MIETHSHRHDPSEVYTATDTLAPTQVAPLENRGAPEDEEGEERHDPENEEEPMEWMDGNGGVYLLRPKRAAKDRNVPGAAVSATQGAIQQFRNIPNGHPKGKGKGAMSRMRCGQPGRFWRQCPQQFRQNLFAGNKGKTTGTKGAQKGKRDR